MGATFTGGDKFNEFIKKAGRGSIRGVDVGVFASAKYPNGTLVAAVAAWNEFGTATIPERPALRNANKSHEKSLLQILKVKVDPETMVVTPRIAALLGTSLQGAMQQSIVSLSSPANEDSTIKGKGSSNTLIASGNYLRSITYQVKR
ncbi:MAG: hypothetical protein KAR40_13855 [Candidatus Sabulitectum sp.]|nr:hypothetical protein [Candidatus Sabulitectum sp.]